MKLQTRINYSLMRYPSLYKAYPDKTVSMKKGDACPQHSRLHVLNFLFLVLGNGLQWSPGGFLFDPNEDHESFPEELPLPEKYYTHDFFVVEVDIEKANDFRDTFNEWIMYSMPGDPYYQQTIIQYFLYHSAPSSVKKKALTWFSPYATYNGIRKPKANVCGIHSPFTPYSISRSCAAMRAVEGQEIGVDGPINLLPDWKAGLVEVAGEARAWWNRHNGDFREMGNCLTIVEHFQQ